MGLSYGNVGHFIIAEVSYVVVDLFGHNSFQMFSNFSRPINQLLSKKFSSVYKFSFILCYKPADQFFLFNFFNFGFHELLIILICLLLDAECTHKQLRISQAFTVHFTKHMEHEFKGVKGFHSN